MKSKRRLGEIDDIFYKLGIAALVATAVAVLLYVCVDVNVLYDVKWPCVFKAATGLYCPGCGGTRAMRSLIKGDIWQSFINHPAVLYGVIVYIIFMIRCFLYRHTNFKFKSFEDGKILPYIYVGIGIMLLQWVVKLIAQIGFGITWVR